MGNKHPGNWFAETFSSDASEDDIVKSRSLNITRITGVVLPVLIGISTAIGEVKNTPPFDDVAFQKRLILAVLLLIAVVTVADILGRSIANLGQSLASRGDNVATMLPKALAARHVNVGLHADGHIVAFRASNASAPTSSGEYLFVATDGSTPPAWLTADVIEQVTAPRAKKR